MATTVASFSAIDDTAIDAESPMVESMMKQMRDNSYWIDAGTRQTTITDTSKVLKPDGAGGVEWGVGGVNGTKGALSTCGTTSGAPTLIAIASGAIVHLTIAGFSYYIDSSDDSYAVYDGNTGTITGSFVDITTSQTVFVRKNGANYEFYRSSGSTSYVYIWL